MPLPRRALLGLFAAPLAIPRPAVTAVEPLAVREVRSPRFRLRLVGTKPARVVWYAGAGYGRPAALQSTATGGRVRMSW